jgi:hypothetical protein
MSPGTASAGLPIPFLPGTAFPLPSQEQEELRAEREHRAAQKRKLGGSVKERNYMLALGARIDEAMLIARMGGVAGARKIFDSICSSPEFPQARQKALFWIARAKVEEQAEEYDAAGAAYASGLGAVAGDVEAEVLKTVHDEFLVRMTSLRQEQEQEVTALLGAADAGESGAGSGSKRAGALDALNELVASPAAAAAAAKSDAEMRRLSFTEMVQEMRDSIVEMKGGAQQPQEQPQEQPKEQPQEQPQEQPKEQPAAPAQEEAPADFFAQYLQQDGAIDGDDLLFGGADDETVMLAESPSAAKTPLRRRSFSGQPAQRVLVKPADEEAESAGSPVQAAVDQRVDQRSVRPATPLGAACRVRTPVAQVEVAEEQPEQELAERAVDRAVPAEAEAEAEVEVRAVETPSKSASKRLRRLSNTPLGAAVRVLVEEPEEAGAAEAMQRPASSQKKRKRCDDADSSDDAGSSSDDSDSGDDCNDIMAAAQAAAGAFLLPTPGKAVKAARTPTPSKSKRPKSEQKLLAEAAPEVVSAVVVLEAVKASSKQAGELGCGTVLTPVRRSARKARCADSDAGATKQLENVGFAYAANPALQQGTHNIPSSGGLHRETLHEKRVKEEAAAEAAGDVVKVELTVDALEAQLDAQAAKKARLASLAARLAATKTSTPKRKAAVSERKGTPRGRSSQKKRARVEEEVLPAPASDAGEESGAGGSAEQHVPATPTSARRSSRRSCTPNK